MGAIREVEEECLVRNLSIISPLSPTYHCYEQKGKNYLKKTYWFKMMCENFDQMAPQQEEGITEVKWFKTNELNKVLSNTYPGIISVLSEVLNNA